MGHLRVGVLLCLFCLVVCVTCDTTYVAYVPWIESDVARTEQDAEQMPSPRCDNRIYRMGNTDMLIMQGGYSELADSSSGTAWDVGTDGNDAGNFTAAYFFNTTSRLWTKPEYSGTAPEQRSGHQTALVSNQLVVWSGLSVESSSILDDGLFVFDTDTMVWDNSITASSTYNASMPLARAYATFTTWGDKIIMVGGVADEFDMDDIWVLDTVTWTWHCVTPTGECFPDVIPTSVVNSTWNASSPDNSSYIVQITVDTEAGTLISADLIYDPDAESDDGEVSSDVAAMLTEPLPTGNISRLEGHSSVLVNNTYLYVVGGYRCNTYGTMQMGGDQCFLSTVYRVTLDSSLAPFTVNLITAGGTAPVGRSYHTVALQNNRLFMFGGAYLDTVRDWNYLNDLHVFDLATNTWEAVSTQGVAPHKRWSVLSTVLSSGNILLSFGCGPPDFFNDVTEMLMDTHILPQNVTVALPDGSSIASNVLASDNFTYQVTARDAAGNAVSWGLGLQLTGQVAGTTSNGLIMFVTTISDNGDGTYNGTFSVPLGGDYNFRVTLSGVDVKGSPFTLSIIESKQTVFAPLDEGLVGAMMAITCILIFGVVGAMVIVHKCRKAKVLKASSPAFLQGILVGALMALAAELLFSLDGGLVTSSYEEAFAANPMEFKLHSLEASSPLTSICCARIWLLSLGYTFLFGCLFAKTRRIATIFKNKKMRKTVVSDKKVWQFFIACLAIDILILTVWMGMSPPTYGLELQSEDSSTRTFRRVCSSDDSQTFVIVILCYKVAMLLYGMFLASQVWSVHISEFNESRQVALAIYNIALCCIFALMMFMVGNQLVISYILTSLGILIGVGGSTSILFAPKFLALWAYRSSSGMYTTTNNRTVKTSVVTNNRTVSGLHTSGVHVASHANTGPRTSGRVGTGSDDGKNENVPLLLSATSSSSVVVQPETPAPPPVTGAWVAPNLIEDPEISADNNKSS
eukprot:GILK01003197.1.p1 GENE.GILK01003197.1~~GILK01003197.1.p1  ORF type:complete len:982 (-),score=110.28 GILK01003197.1:191-3100(-)